jgi:hypothetical protein
VKARGARPLDDIQFQGDGARPWAIKRPGPTWEFWRADRMKIDYGHLFLFARDPNSSETGNPRSRVVVVIPPREWLQIEELVEEGS